MAPFATCLESHQTGAIVDQAGESSSLTAFTVVPPLLAGEGVRSGALAEAVWPGERDAPSDRPGPRSVKAL